MKVYGELSMSKVPGSRKGTAFDIIKELLIILLVVLCLFLYWMAMLLVISMMLVNLWKVLLEELVILAIVLTIISAIFYIRHRRNKWIREN